MVPAAGVEDRDEASAELVVDDAEYQRSRRSALLSLHGNRTPKGMSRVRAPEGVVPARDPIASISFQR